MEAKTKKENDDIFLEDITVITKDNRKFTFAFFSEFKLFMSKLKTRIKL